jgi:uncharacterized protein (TIRG00374 family)
MTVHGISEKQGLTRRKACFFAVKAGLSFLILWMVFRYLGSPETRLILKSADVRWILAGATCIVFVQFLKAWRFIELGRVLNQPVPVLRCVLAHVIVPILGFITPGKLGEGFKIMYLKASKKELGFVFIVERLQDMLMLLAVAAFGFAFSDLYILTYLVMAGIVLAGIIVLMKLEWMLNLVTRKLFQKEYFTKNWFMQRLRKVFSPRILNASLLTVAVWGVTFTSSFCFARSVGIDLPYAKIAFVFAWAVILGLLSSLPGGVGVREGGITVLMHTLYAVPKPLGTALAAINLGMHYIVLSILAAAGYFLYHLLLAEKEP